MEPEKHQAIKNFNTTNACKYAKRTVVEIINCSNLLKIVAVKPGKFIVI